MSTLLLRLAGPMQSWGTQSRFTHRDTGREPSKSGVIGLVCAAMGRPRAVPLDDLRALRMGVRVDREGSLSRDFHTAGGSHRRGDPYGVVKNDGGRGGTVVSDRYYLADADFLVGLEGDDALLRTIDAAFVAPKWQLCLGRKAFVPGSPVRLPDLPGIGSGLRSESLIGALTGYPWTAGGRPANGQEPRRCRVVIDAETNSGHETRYDVPVSFAERAFTLRYVLTDWIIPVADTEE